jgi:hypothetical protein
MINCDDIYYFAKSNLNQGAVMRKFISPEKKAEILSYIEMYNARNGRGGKVSAAEKFKVSRVAIDRWLADGVDGASPAGAARGAKRKAPQDLARTAEILQALVVLDLIQHSIPSLRKKLESLARKLK